MNDKEFFEGQAISFTFNDLIKERDELLGLLKGNGPITKRVRALTLMAPDAIGRFYTHKSSPSFIKWLVIVWTVTIAIIKVGFVGEKDPNLVDDNLNKAEKENKIEEKQTDTESKSEADDQGSPIMTTEDGDEMKIHN